MRARVVSLIAALFLTGAPALAADYYGTVQLVQAGHTTLNCFFFKITNATNIVPQGAGDWFAVSKSDPDFKEIYAMVISAKLTDRELRVQTSSNLACGYAEASYVFLL